MKGWNTWTPLPSNQKLQRSCDLVDVINVSGFSFFSSTMKGLEERVPEDTATSNILGLWLPSWPISPLWNIQVKNVWRFLPSGIPHRKVCRGRQHPCSFPLVILWVPLREPPLPLLPCPYALSVALTNSRTGLTSVSQILKDHDQSSQNES